MLPVLFGLSALESISAEEAEVTAEAVKRALPYLEEEGTWWIEKKDCVSCHHTTFLLWAKDLALDKGITAEVNRESLEDQREWTWQSFLEFAEEDEEDSGVPVTEGERKGARNIEGVSQFLLSSSRRHAPDEVVSQLVEMVRTTQGEDGNWSPGGQLPRQKRPETETAGLSNQWASLALKDNDASPLRAVPSVTAASNAITTEVFLMASFAGALEPESLTSLRQRQNDDGGWGWKKGEPSDPTGTAQAIMTLLRSAESSDHNEAQARGIDYLVETQQPDGRWVNPSTKNREESGRVSDFWGTAWAVIALLEAMPETGTTTP